MYQVVGLVRESSESTVRMRGPPCRVPDKNYIPLAVRIKTTASDGQMWCFHKIKKCHIWLKGLYPVFQVHLVFVRSQKQAENQDFGGVWVVLIVHARHSLHTRRCTAGYTNWTAPRRHVSPVDSSSRRATSVFMYRCSGLTFALPKAAQG